MKFRNGFHVNSLSANHFAGLWEHAEKIAIKTMETVTYCDYQSCVMLSGGNTKDVARQAEKGRLQGVALHFSVFPLRFLMSLKHTEFCRAD
ncbi:hypothetical protein [Serratia fonticola]|uniref:hypothetical protein n=1 Tax=Serratia fonticola TaxID=47917 RepID=UPI002DB930EB|nr:hypothetical protein [Serratia fonticola]MEB7886007.1 hypothetical protein [Serratia fonticola]